MPSATQPAKKTCVVCGTDVDGKPRVKDAQGRYACKGACEAKLLKPAAPAPSQGPAPKPAAGSLTPVIPAGSPGPDDILGKLISASPVLNSRPCPSCGSPLVKGAIVCTNCGTNAETGKKLKTAIIKEKEEKAPKVKPGARSNRYASSGEAGFFKTFGFLSIALSLASLCVFAGPSGLTAGIVILLIAGFIAWLGSVVSAFRNDQSLMGLLMLLPITTPIALLIFNILFNEDTRSRALYWATFVGWIAFGVAIGASAAMGMRGNLG